MNEPLFPTPPKLTDRQALVYHQLNQGPLTAFRAGALLHERADCRWCRLGGGWGSCNYAEQAGREVLWALRTKCLVRRDRHHVYTRIDIAVPSAQGDLPEGF
jgi:hypothetical protein